MILNSNSFLFYFICLLLLLSSFKFVTSFVPPQLCHGNERSSLLQFKDNFVIDCQASIDRNSYPKVESWKLRRDCCSWDGVTCDDRSGHVVELDLSNSCLFGSVNSSITLFHHLTHLRTLNLANNDFNFSQIPSDLLLLSQLTSLNLSSLNLDGQVPSTISQLSKLCALDLSYNGNLLLKKPDFYRLVENLTRLEHLKLGWVYVPSTIPLSLSNLTSLKSLRLSYCDLYGGFPVEIFQLPQLQTLHVHANSDLKGYLPEFNFSSLLQSLRTSETSFSGEIPDSIGNLSSLNEFDISYCSFSGQVPASLGNLLELQQLNIGINHFEVNDSSSSFSWIGKLNKLFALGLASISFKNGFPPYFSNQTKLTSLDLNHCEIEGRIPSWVMNMTRLVELDLSKNKLQGQIPDSFFQLGELEYLNLSRNRNLSGTVELALFLNNFKKLTSLDLSYGNLSVINNDISNSSSAKLLDLLLAECNLKKFPNVLRYQGQLEWLKLADNFIQGPIPRWVVNASENSLAVINLSDNFFTGFEEDLILFPWSQATVVDLSNNMLRGSLPIPPPSTVDYLMFNNDLNGHISPEICESTTLRGLDLSYNNFTGSIPPCLANSIQFLNLEGNKLDGIIPDSFTQDCNLRMLSLDSNDLEGEIPRSLSNCIKLDFLSLGNNKINDVFPSWLGSLHELKVLILRSNRFHGELDNHFDLPSLSIIDLSQNNFSGKLPIRYFLSWDAMKMARQDQLVYMNTTLPARFSKRSVSVLPPFFTYSMNITNKGAPRRYPKIIESFVAIDFSRNNFEGEIPQVIGNLIGLRLLNFSNNNLSGSIPASLANLTELESLDLSRNNLMGKIPQELTKLGFLSVFNVSYNNLTGSIPHGKQFETFENSTYLNNSGLCGFPLSNKCENLTWSFEVGEDSDSFFEFSWKSVVMGYSCGLIIGVVIGHIVVRKRLEWFFKTFKIT